MTVLVCIFHYTRDSIVSGAVSLGEAIVPTRILPYTVVEVRVDKHTVGVRGHNSHPYRLEATEIFLPHGRDSSLAKYRPTDYFALLH